MIMKKKNTSAHLRLIGGLASFILIATGAVLLVWRLFMKKGPHIEIETLLAKVMKLGQDAEMKLGQIVSRVRDNYYKDTGESFEYDIDTVIQDSQKILEDTGTEIKEQLQREQSPVYRVLNRS